MKDKIKSMFRGLFYAPFGWVCIYFWIFFSASYAIFKIYFEIRYHFLDHILLMVFISGILFFSLIAFIVFFVQKKREKNYNARKQ